MFFTVLLIQRCQLSLLSSCHLLRENNDQSVIVEYFSEGEINFGLFNSFINNEGKYNNGILSSVLYNN